MEAIDQQRYESVYVTITTSAWTSEDASGMALGLDRSDLTIDRGKGRETVSAALIAIHGTPGEDGKLQGYLDMLNIPYQTGDVLCMSVTFSKYATIALLGQQGFPVAPSVLIHRHSNIDQKEIEALGLPVFVKPDRSGSSLGVSKVKSAGDLENALEVAFAECDQVLVEGAVTGRELTCGVFRDATGVQALPICEIRTSREFFDFEAKYHATDTEEIIPAPLPDHITRAIQERSAAIYQAFNCKGMVRVDHFWTGGEDPASIVTIELNTTPGFSGASIFPKMIEASGRNIPAVINGLIEEMLQR